ncbi:MAG: hypothetical protein R3Y26_05345 [Rikenellaceae bacterium]
MKIKGRIFVNTFATFVLLIVFLPIYVSLILNISFVQNLIVGYLSNVASEYLQTEVSVKNIDVNLFYSAELSGIYVEDPIESDTLLYIDNVKVRLDALNFSKGVNLKYTKMQGGKFYLNNDEKDSVLNLKYIVTKLKSKDPNPKPFVLNIANIDITNLDFKFIRFKNVIPQESGINYQDMQFNSARISAKDFALVKDSFEVSIDSLYFTEKSGFNVLNVEIDKYKASPSGMMFENGKINFENSYFDIESYSMSYKEWNMYDYINRVPMNVVIREANLDFHDIDKFTFKELPLGLVASFKGSASGVISDLTATIKDFKTYNTTLKEVNATIVGLPNIESSKFNIDIKALNSSCEDAKKIVLDMTNKEMPFFKVLQPLRKIDFNGNFNGSLKSFKSKGVISTNLGLLDFNVSNRPSAEGLKLKGNVNVNKFNIGRMFNVKNLEDVSFTGDLDAIVGSESLIMDTKAKVLSLNYNSYNYTDIDIDGKIVNKTFFGYVGCDDTNIDFKFNGSLDLGVDVPVYDFKLNVNKADLVALNMVHKDSVSILSGLLVADGSGINIDNINGDLCLDSLQYINSIDTVNVDSVIFRTRNSENFKKMELESKFMNAILQGKQSYSNIFGYLIATVRKYLPSLQNNLNNQNSKGSYRIKTGSALIDNSLLTDGDLQEAEDGYYIAVIDVKEANNVASIFMPGLEVAEGTSLSFIFNPALNEFNFDFESKYINHNNTHISDIIVSSSSSRDSISISAQSKEMMFNNVYIPNFVLLGGVKNNSVNIDSRFINSNDNSEALISTHSVIYRDSETGQLKLNVSLLQSRFSLGKDNWNTTESLITIDDSKINISKFDIKSSDKSISIWGDISKNIDDTLNIKIDNIDIEPITELTDTMGFYIGGNLDGDIKIASMLNKPRLLTDLLLRGVTVNDKKFNDARFKSSWSELRQSTLFSLTQDDVEPLIQGAFRINEKLVYADVKIDSVDLSLIDPFTKLMFSDIDGSANVNVRVSNPNKKLRIDGSVDINKFETTVDFTKVRYNVSGKVNIDNNYYKISEGIIKDEEGASCALNGEMFADGYKKVRYSISANPKNMLFMNTSINDNDTFYGHIYGSGYIGVQGHGTDVVMDVIAKSDNNSTFFMPLSSKTSITQADFITFVEPEKEEEDVKLSLFNRMKSSRAKAKGSFALNLDLDVQPNLDAQIVIDPTVGDIIRGRGTGSLQITVNPSIGEFTINGGVEITEGGYLFTLSDIINKYFTIQSGSTINWTGNPTDANLNITATYKVKTSLAPLLGNDTQFSQRVEVDCDLSLAGKLLKPDINLGISLPTIDPEVQSYVNSVLNTEEAISTQVFWLLFANTFYEDSNNAAFSSSGLTTGAAVTGLEFLSNQISNWVSNDKFNIGFSYRPKGDMTSDEIELRTSAPLKKDKLFLDVEGSLDFKNNLAYVTENVKMFTVDASLTYIADSLSNVTSKLYTRPIETFDENQGLQEVGIGLYYRYDFDRFSELLDSFRVARLRKTKTKQVKREKIAEMGRKAYRISKRKEEEEE